MPVTQSEVFPTAKTNAGGIAALVVLVLVWALKQWAHVDMPPEVAAAITGIVTYVASYLAPPKARDQVVHDWAAEE